MPLKLYIFHMIRGYMGIIYLPMIDLPSGGAVMATTVCSVASGSGQSPSLDPNAFETIPLDSFFCAQIIMRAVSSLAPQRHD